MWLVSAVAAAAFLGNLGAEILAEGVADFTAQMYWDWFWSFDSAKTMTDATAEFDSIQKMIAEAEQKMYLPPTSAR